MNHGHEPKDTHMNHRTYTATPAGLANLLRDLADLIDTATAPAPVDYSRLFNELEALINEATALVPPPTPQALATYRAAMTNDIKPATRDWAGFLAAVAAFMEKILPLILPLFTQPKS
jgi:hypothetical protein